MKGLKFLRTCLAVLAVSVSLSGAALAKITEPVSVEDGEMVVRGILDTAKAGSVNCTVAPKTADASDLSKVVYLREISAAEDGSFELKFVFDDSTASGTYTVRTSDGAGSISSVDFDYYPYKGVISAVEAVTSGSELLSVLTDSANADALKLLGIDASLLSDAVIDEAAIVNELYTAVQAENLSFDETAVLYSRLTALALLNSGRDGQLAGFNPAFENEAYNNISDADKKAWLDENVKDAAPYASIDKLNDKYEELSVLYKLNNAAASELGGLIDSYKSKIGLTSESSYSSYTAMNLSKQNTMLGILSLGLETAKPDTYADFKKEFKEAADEALKGGGGSGGSSGGTGGGGGGSLGKIVASGDTLSVETGGETTGGEAAAASGKFSDEGSFGWARSYITYLTDNGILAGFEDGTFRPDERVTREQFVKMITFAFNIERTNEKTIAFSDVAADDWCFEPVAAAYENGIITGIDETRFGVGASITREDAAVILERTSKARNGGDLPVMTAYRFADDGAISDYAKNSVYSMYHAGIINGKGGDVFAPSDYLTRAEAAKLIYCLLTKGE